MRIQLLCGALALTTTLLAGPIWAGEVLDLEGDSPRIHFGETDTGKDWFMVLGAGKLDIREDNTSGSSSRLRIQPGGAVGIGTQSPAARLDVRGAVYFEGGRGDANDDGFVNALDLLPLLDYITGAQPMTPAIEARIDTNGDGRVSYDDLGVVVRMVAGDAKEDAIRKIESGFGMTDANTFFVAGGVQVGIGASDPLADLHVAGDFRAENKLTLEGSGTVEADLGFAAGTDDLELGHSANSSKIVLSSNGNICIGSGC